MKKQKTEIPHDILDLLGWKDITTSKQYKNGTRIFELPIKKYGQYIKVGSFRSGYVRRMNGGYTPYQLNKCEPNTEYHKEYKWVPNLQNGYSPVETGKYTKYEGKKRILIPHEADRIDHLITYCLKNYYINGANQVEDGKFVSKWQHEYEMKNGSLDRVRELQAENRKLTQEMDEMNDKHTDMCNRFESAAMELSDLHCSGKDSKIKELQQEMDNICEEHNSKDQKYTWSGGQITDSETGEIYVHEQHAYWNKIPNSVQVIVDGHRYNVK